MRQISFIVLLINNLISLDAQSGSNSITGKVSLGYNYNIPLSEIKVKLELGHSDTILSKITITDANSAFIFSNLKSGTYFLKATADGYVDKVIYNIKLKNKDCRIINIYLQSLWCIDSISIDHSEQDMSSFYIIENFYFSSNSLDKNQFRGLFGAEFGLSGKYEIISHYSLGFEFMMIDINRIRLNTGNADTKSIETYFWSTLGLNLTNKFCITKIKKAHPGWFLEFGLGYNYPYKFLYKNKYHHQDTLFKEKLNLKHSGYFTGIIRLGFSVFSINAKIRLSDIIKEENDFYKEPPAIMFGIGLNFGEVFNDY